MALPTTWKCWCGGSAQEDLIKCPGCNAHYHNECWRDLDGCAVFGCDERGSRLDEIIQEIDSYDNEVYDNEIPQDIFSEEEESAVSSKKEKPERRSLSLFFTRVLGGERSIAETYKEALTMGVVYTMRDIFPYRESVRYNFPRCDFMVLPFFSASEELIGPDIHGRYGPKGDAVLVVTHGTALVTPDRLEEAIKNGQAFVSFTEKEFSNLLEGRIGADETIPIVSWRRFVKQGGWDWKRYGVVIPFKTAAEIPDGDYSAQGAGKIIIQHARMGGSPDNLCLRDPRGSDYIQLYQHRFGWKEEDVCPPKGTLLYLYNDHEIPTSPIPHPLPPLPPFFLPERGDLRNGGLIAVEKRTKKRYEPTGRRGGWPDSWDWNSEHQNCGGCLGRIFKPNKKF